MLSSGETLYAARKDEEALLLQSPSRERPIAPAACPATGSLLRRAAHLAGQCVSFLKPSFLARRPALDAVEKPQLPKRHATEYLDGVRGVASLIVFILHWTHITYPSVNWGWGYEGRTSLWLLPFVRLIFSGAAMVSVFFVVSGFVLSHRFVQRMHRREYPELFAGLTSLAFRRAVRLFVPAFVSSFLAFVCAGLGIVDVPKRVGGAPFQHGVPAFLDYLDAESNPWTWDHTFSGFYNPQLWSISVEYRGSMVVFLLVMGLAKTRTSVRIAVETLLVTHCFGHKRWDVALFIAGMLIAELQVLFDKSGARGQPRAVAAALYLVLVVGVYLSGYPREHNTETLGYMWTAHVWPSGLYRRRFWLGISAILITGPIAFLPPVQAIFLTRPTRYLGRISYALYLVHGLGNRTVGKWLLGTFWVTIGKEGTVRYALSFALASSLYVPLIIWSSDVFWRSVDVGSTDLARWLEKKCAAREAPCL
ncbi:hypothetical protein GQ53DRAFT_215149 [Thozetella sp. PMI_491]|nr:hypothetical protein GQ53DRAFT_215149 [Thozetella sp. PMI_491]